MKTYTLEDVVKAYETLKKNLIIKENEIHTLHQERMEIWKRISTVTDKLDMMCEHQWKRESIYQFAPLKCSVCGRLKNE